MDLSDNVLSANFSSWNDQLTLQKTNREKPTLTMTNLKKERQKTKERKKERKKERNIEMPNRERGTIWSGMREKNPSSKHLKSFEAFSTEQQEETIR